MKPTNHTKQIGFKFKRKMYLKNLKKRQNKRKELK